MMIRRTWIALVSFMLVGATAFAQPPQTGAASDGFVPLSSLPPGEELPAARFVIASYAFFLLLMLFYLWTIWNRLSKVEKDMKDLERRQGGATR
ncbi:MAG: heme exporter protein CcmD [Vicinamibacterales bacterium]